jgi:hypothetical protein
MSVPIDKLLDWFDRDIDAGCAEHSQIRAILAQHRDHSGHDPHLCEVKWRELEAIRAFVERATKKADGVALPNYWCESFTKAIGEELAAMEKGSQ